MMSDAPYTFRVRKIHELVEEMRTEFPNLAISESDFRNPKEDRWEEIYLNVMSLLGVDTDNLCRLPTKEEFEHPELYVVIVQRMRIVKAMKRVLRGMGFDNASISFELNDLLNPEISRLRIICSAIANFIPFMKTRQEKIEEMQKVVGSKVEARMDLQQRCEELQSKVNSIKQKRAMRQPEIEQMTAEFHEKHAYCEKLMAKHALLKDKQEEQKAASAKFRTKKASLIEKLAVAKEEHRQISSMIVSSPDRIQSEMDHNEKQLQDSKELRGQKLVRLNEIKRRKSATAQASEEYKDALKMIKALQEKKEAMKELQKEISTIKEKTAEGKENLWETKNQLDFLKRANATKKEKFDKMQLQMGQKLDDIKAEVNQLIRENVILVEENDKRSLEEKDVSSALNQLKLKEKEMTEQHMDEMTRLRATYDKLLQELDRYHVRLSEQIQSLFTAMKK